MTSRAEFNGRHLLARSFDDDPPNTAITLVEVCTAALTTEPELRDIGRSLIALVRYYARGGHAPDLPASRRVLRH